VGEKQNDHFQLSFKLVRELDERLGFGELITQHLSDARRGKNTQLPLADLLRTSVFDTTRKSRFSKRTAGPEV
jgi:hypothetical protein